MSYNRASLYNGDNFMLDLEGPLTENYINGMGTALNLINLNFDEDYQIEISDDISTYMLDLSENNNITYKNINPDELMAYSSPVGYFAWWLLNKNKVGYDLYIFDESDTTEFVNGFISTFEYFDLDFRDYSLGTPFKTVNSRNIFTEIYGYDVAAIQTEQDQPDPDSYYYEQLFEEYY